MEFKIVGRGVDVSEEIKQRIVEKISKADKYGYFKKDTIATVVVREERAEKIIECCATQDSNRFCVEGRSWSTIYDAIDDLEHTLTRQLRDYKKKFMSKRQRRAKEHEARKNSVDSLGFMDAWNEDAEDATEDIGGQIVREKHINLAMMSAEEAIEQMNLLGHSFYLYLDGDTGLSAVVYRRDDGNYGVIKAN